MGPPGVLSGTAGLARKKTPGKEGGQGANEQEESGDRIAAAGVGVGEHIAQYSAQRRAGLLGFLEEMRFVFGANLREWRIPAHTS